MQGLEECGCRLLALDVVQPDQIDAAVVRVPAAGKSWARLMHACTRPHACVRSTHPLRAQATVLAEAGQIDVLVNNAGVLAKAPVMEAGRRHFQHVMGVNFFGAIELAAAVAPSMVARRCGAIINIGSIASYSFQPFWAAYNASKAALMAATDTLRCELQPFGVRVVYVAPGAPLLVLSGSIVSGSVVSSRVRACFVSLAGSAQIVMLARAHPTLCRLHRYASG